MAKKPGNTLPPSPLAWRKFYTIDFEDPDQRRAAVRDLEKWFHDLSEERRRFGNEFDRAVADVLAWAEAICAEAGLGPDHIASADDYPSEVWYATQVRSRISEIRDLQGRDPQEAVSCALYLGELIDEARAHLGHGPDAARGLKGRQSARAGHEQVHGDEEAKHRRWREQVQAYEKFRAAGHPKTEAVKLAAKECKTSERSIYNARSRLR